MEHDRPRTRQAKSGFLLKYLQGLCQSVHSVPWIVIAIKQGFQSVFISDKYTMKLHRTHRKKSLQAICAVTSQQAVSVLV